MPDFLTHQTSVSGAAEETAKQTPFKSLPLGLLLGLETLINPALRNLVSAQSPSAAHLERLDGKNLHVQFAASPVALGISFFNGQIYLSSGDKTSADAWLEAPFSALVQAVTQADANLFTHKGVQVGGQTGLWEALQQLFSSLQQDTLEALSRLLAASPLNLLPLSPSLAGIESKAAGLQQWLQNLHTAFWRDSQNYVDDEAQILAGKKSWHLALNLSQELQQETSRLAARIALLGEKIK